MMNKYMLKSLFAFCLVSASFSWGQTVIFTEDFEAGIPANWGIRNYDGLSPDAAVSEYTAGYISKADPADTSNLTASSTSFFSPVGEANRWLITEPIVLGSFGNSFRWKAKSHDPSYPETYLVLISQTDTLAASFTDTLGYVIEENEDWTTRIVNLSAQGYDNQTIYVAFILQTDDGFKFYLDDVSASKEDPVGLDEQESSPLVFKTIQNGLYEIVLEGSLDQVQVYNAKGELISESASKEVNLLQAESGIYFVQARQGNHLYFNKVIR